MDTDNPILRRIEQKHRRDKEVNEAFERWFELVAGAINPLMNKDDCRAIFIDGFECGQAYSMDSVMNSFTEMLEAKQKARE